MASLSKKKSEVKFSMAHLAGQCDIVFHPNGSLLFTCGEDLMVKAIDIKDPTAKHSTIDIHKDAVNAIAFNRTGDRIASASSDHQVLVHRVTPSLEMDKLVTRFLLPARTVDWSPKDAYIAAAGDDGVIKIVLVADTTQIKYLKPDAPVRFLQYDPKDTFLASAGCDGTFHIWNTEDGSQVASLKTFFPENVVGEDTQFCKFAWHPTGDFIAMPGHKEIKCIKRDSWEVAFSMKGSHSAPVSILSWSPNGRYLASVDTDNVVFVWDATTKDTLHRFKHSRTICGISWNPKANSIAMIDVDGQYGIWENVIPRSAPNPFQLLGDLKSNAQNPLANLFSPADDELLNKTSDDEGEDVGTNPKPGEDLDDEDSEKKPAPKPQRDELDVIDGVHIDGEDVDDDDLVDLSHKKKAKAKLLKAKKEKGAAAQVPVRSIPTFRAQPPFQPGSSELEAKRRYLCFNTIGTVVSRDEHSHLTIEIEYHDVAKHKPVKLNDRNNVTMGCLANKGAVFASPIRGEFASTLSYHPIESWGTNPKWSYTLPNTEQVLAVGVCDDYICAVTSKNFVRVFTLTGGMQYSIMSIGGPVVAVGSSHAGNMLAVIYHASNPINDSQNLACLEIDLTNTTGGGTGVVYRTFPVPLTPTSTLKWVGYSPAGFLATCDSAGVVRLCGGVAAASQWFPLLEVSPKHWMFGVSDKHINCVKLRDADASPPTFPRPVPDVIAFTAPFFHVESETGQLEEKYFREKLFVKMRESSASADSAKKQQLIRDKATLDTYLLQLLQLAIKGDKTERALMLSDYLEFERPLQAAIDMATKGAILIVDPVQRRKFGVDSDAEDDEEEGEDEDEEMEEDQSVPASSSTNAPSKSKPVSESMDDYDDEDSSVPPTSKQSNNNNNNNNTSKTSGKLAKALLQQEEDNTPKKRNRFAKDGVATTNTNNNNSKSTDKPKPNLLESLNQLQTASKEPKQKRRKLQTLFQ